MPGVAELPPCSRRGSFPNMGVPVTAIRIPPTTFRAVTTGLADPDRREMAVPSYTHWNPLIRWLFWDRLDVSVRLADVQPGEAVFEFAAGTGILLPTHHAVARRVACTDLHPGPAMAMAKLSGFPTEHVPLESLESWASSNEAKFDCIYAIDCLDHVSEKELDALVPVFGRLMGPRGRLVMCGPTESTWYKLGRFVAGFRNEYHHRTVFDVDRLLRKHFAREAWVGLPRSPLPRGFWIGRYVSASR